jgi:hypothetical protein
MSPGVLEDQVEVPWFVDVIEKRKCGAEDEDADGTHKAEQGPRTQFGIRAAKSGITSFRTKLGAGPAATLYLQGLHRIRYDSEELPGMQGNIRYSMLVARSSIEHRAMISAASAELLDRITCGIL